MSASALRRNDGFGVQHISGTRLGHAHKKTTHKSTAVLSNSEVLKVVLRYCGLLVLMMLVLFRENSVNHPVGIADKQTPHRKQQGNTTRNGPAT